MNTLWQDLRYAVRMLLKNPGFTAVAVLTLSLGIGANTAIFSVVNAVLLRPLPYPEAGRILRVGQQFGDFVAAAGEPKYLFWREHNRSFEALAAYQYIGSGFNLTGGNEAEFVNALRVSEEFFRLLGVSPALGRSFTRTEDQPGGQPVVIISDGLWRRRFGADAGLIGQRIALNGKAYTLVGVMATQFRFLPQADVMVPMQPSLTGDPNPNQMVIGRLKPGVTEAQARADMKQLADAYRAAHPQQMRPKESAGVEPYQQFFTDRIEQLLWILFGAVGFLLLIACANVANLLLARGSGGGKETAVGAALGAGRGRIVRQLLTESVLLSVMGGAAGLLLASWGLEWLSRLGAGSVPRLEEVRIDRGVLFFTLGVSLLTGVVSGLLPALRSVAVDLYGSLKEGGRRTVAVGRQRWRQSLIVAEVVLALMVLIGARLLGRSFAKQVGQDAGFDPSHVLALRIEPRMRVEFKGQSPETYQQQVAAERDQIAHFYDQLLEQVNALAGVQTAAAVSFKPLSGNFWSTLVVFRDRPIPPENEMPVAQVRVVTPGYFQTMGARLLRGRAPSGDDASVAARVAVINETMAHRHWPGRDPIGHHIATSNNRNNWMEIIGIVPDVRQAMDRDPAPLIYLPLAQARAGFYKNWGMDVVVRAERDPSKLAAAVGDLVHSLDKDLPVVRISLMEQVVADSVASRRFSVMLLGVFSAVAFVLAAVGI